MQAATHSAAFAVHDVTPGTERLATVKTQESVAALLGGRVEACVDYTTHCLGGVGFHPLIAAAQLAWSHHFPLVLSPDMIWVTVLQGFAQHVKQDPERHRGRLVAHAERETLTVEADVVPGSPENDWAAVVGGFIEGVRTKVRAGNDWLSAEFSTTGPAERAAAHIALLDAMQFYFEYRVYAVCGIPSVRLEGTPADWDSLAERVERLDDFGLGWWLEHLRPILGQFCRAVRGDIDLNHWRNLFKRLDAYGGALLNGWLLKLVPYLKSFQTGNISVRNELLDGPFKPYPKAPAVPKPTSGGGRFTAADSGVWTNQLPTGLSAAPFILEGPRCPEPLAMEFLGGFVGVTQDADTLALRPKLGWAARGRSALDQLLLRLRGHAMRPPLAPPEFDAAIQGIRTMTLSGDFLSFYKACDGGELSGCSFRPLTGLEAIEVPIPKGSEIYREHDLGVEGYVPTCHWRRLVDLPDGSFLALSLRGEYANEVGHDLDLPELFEREVFLVVHCRPTEPDARNAYRVVAWSLSELLMRLLDAGGPYFLAPDFVDRGDAFTKPRWSGPMPPGVRLVP